MSSVSVAAPSCPAASPSLAIYQPCCAAYEISSDLTLAEFYRAAYVVLVEIPKNNHADTRAQNAAAVKLWQQFTGDPPLAQIDRFSCAKFVAGLSTSSKISSPTTINKHCSAIQKILRLAGPYAPNERDCQNLDLLARVPYINKPAKVQQSNQEPWTFGELERHLEKADWFRRPAHLKVTAPVYWRSLFLLEFATGMRVQESIRCEWRDVRGDHIVIPNHKRKGGRRGHTVELNDVALAALAAMRGCHEERVFPWPAKWVSRKAFYDELREFRRTFFPDRMDIKPNHAMRRLHNVELLKINERACAAALGHNEKVNAQAYVGRQVVKDAVSRLPAPRILPDRQLALFE